LSVQFLDCTLRDGAHVNSGNFGENHIKNIISGLTEASVDIVEIGFLKDVEYSHEFTYFPYIEDAYNMISDVPSKQGVIYSLMARADQYDINNLSECNGRIKLIRIAFYYDYLEKAIDFAKKVKAKGYDFTLNLINTPGCSLQELNELIKYANEVNPYAVMIVDTFGVLDIKSLKIIAEEYSQKLNSNIRIGLHPHENMSLGFSLAQEFVKSIGCKRDIIVDGSLMGMGRAPGNLCTELICDYLNNNNEKKFNLPRILELIENDVAPIKKTHRWGYSPEFFLSAKYRVHRSYAEYLFDIGIGLKQINQLLSKIEPDYAAKFNKEYLMNLLKR
jgi:4-hydroxy 2-oxovalerate aldolase